MPKPPKALERLWYAKLAKSGFKDIENTSLPDRPLIDWHSFKFISRASQLMQEANNPYQEQIDDFFNSHDFHEVCKRVTSNKSVKYGPKTARLVWKLHCEGLTTREIATETSLTQTQVQNLISKLREWLRLI